jgi:hypothetical protein
MEALLLVKLLFILLKGLAPSQVQGMYIVFVQTANPKTVDMLLF